MSNIIHISDFRNRRAVAALQTCPADYVSAVKWAGGDFDRLVHVCKDRGYRPGWITEQFGGGAKRLSPSQAESIARLRPIAGPPHLNHRLRWILYKLADGVTDDALVEAAQTAAPYASCKDVSYCVANDLRKIEILLDDGDISLPLSKAM
ncbi:hypothetical protein ACVW1C_001884 [Bradyrhizobium sp. USDA 4011]